MTSRPTVWFVDDLPVNLTTFAAAHGQEFNVQTFAEPSKVLALIDANERPDALLCDIFFYETPEKAEKIERRITDEAAKLSKTADEIGAATAKYLAGIDLIEAIAQKFSGSPPFPVYAYTSKGPYLLQQAAWDRIVGSGAKVLLKGRFSPQSERVLIQRDIHAAREGRSLGAKVRRYLTTVLITTGLLGAILGVLLDRVVRWIWLNG